MNIIQIKESLKGDRQDFLRNLSALLSASRDILYNYILMMIEIERGATRKFTYGNEAKWNINLFETKNSAFSLRIVSLRNEEGDIIDSEYTLIISTEGEKDQEKEYLGNTLCEFRGKANQKIINYSFSFSGGSTSWCYKIIDRLHLAHLEEIIDYSDKDGFLIKHESDEDGISIESRPYGLSGGYQLESYINLLRSQVNIYGVSFISVDLH